MEQQETFETWARQERQDLVRFAVLVTANREAAVRVTQEALARLRRDYAEVCDTGDPATAARRLVVAGAQQLATGPEGLPADPPRPGSGPAREWAYRVWTQRPPGVRAAVALHVLDGLSVMEVVWTLQVGEATVRSQVQLTLMEVAGVAQHRGRTTEAMAKVEPVLREVLAAMVTGAQPVVEIPPAAPRSYLRTAVVVAATALLAAVIAIPVAAPPAPPSPVPTTVEPAPGIPRWPGEAPPTATSLPPPAQGRRWVSSRDVAIQVPVSWRLSPRSSDWGWVELSSDGRTCADASVAVVVCAASTVSQMVAIQPYVPAAPIGGANLTGVLVRQAGTIWLVGGTPRGGDLDLVESILASAVVITEDANGCPVRHPAAGAVGTARPAPPADLAAWPGEAGVVICRYNREPPTAATLVGSELLPRPRADALVAAVLRAPPERDRCLSGFPAEHVVVLRALVAQRAQEVYVYPNNCQENHSDDGVSRREVTVELCRLLGLPTGDPTRCGG